MGALLASIGVKDYVYAGLIATLIGAFAYYTHHERVIGADDALAPIVVLAHKAEVQVAVGTAAAQATEKDNVATYTAAVAAPVPADLGLVCHNGPSGGDVPEASRVEAALSGNDAPDSAVGPAFDPSGAALERAAKADAEIVWLQGRVLELESQMNASP